MASDSTKFRGHPVTANDESGRPNDAGGNSPEGTFDLAPSTDAGLSPWRVV